MRTSGKVRPADFAIARFHEAF
ncbi:hypothetical protein SIAM614_08988 [Stappia aggregata IAM 12614]|uniref:Uncharacterized protein n=1 Tax=Roseibium aggregatum (strain ATCC 25650 / DSM 13394 / JCM 20685 / NBRC 16684 / NCIMB 2208 / IAM 12614 / B1) TaxID=384765 RepID=A0NLK5_ROSAI|nr:hypothetical protein SIAM614_08988 [Stappia aggregata IAM 12614] [Roseibium aggregatum IAM 12614]